jgi:hypothetical protein
MWKIVGMRGRPPIAQSPRRSALSRRAAVYADAKKTEKPPELGMRHWSTRYEQPIDPRASSESRGRHHE